MYRIIKIESESFENICFYHIVEQSEDYQHINIYYQESINSPESLRECIQHFLKYNKFYKHICFYGWLRHNIKLIDELESLDLDYIKNRFIHYLI